MYNDIFHTEGKLFAFFFNIIPIDYNTFSYGLL